MKPSADILITVLMPVYNASSFLREAIQSILDQSYSHFELIIINDGSTDASVDIILGFNDPRIVFVNNKQNQGIIKTRNIGLGLAKGKYIANMDADDVSLPTRLEKQLAYMEQYPETVVLASHLILINQKNEEIGIWPEDIAAATPEAIHDMLPVINCIGQPTIMMRADVVKALGYKDFKNNEDWGLWLEILSAGHVITKLPETLLLYRQHTSNTTVIANDSGVEKKIIKFKYEYLRYKLLTFKFRYTDRRVFGSFIKDLARFVMKKAFPRLYALNLLVKNIHIRRYIQQRWHTRKIVEEQGKNVPVIYFFPSFHTGGAERVHASILEAANEHASLVFITSPSDNRAFYETFSKYAVAIEVYELIKTYSGKQWLYEQINAVIKKSDQVRLFACNSAFFYELLPHLPSHIPCIDLIHAFVHRHEDGPEKWSLPVIERLSTRVVINNKTRSDFAEFYERHQVPVQLLSRIRLIPNFVEALPLPEKSSGKMKVAYVGRGSEEKRIDLIARLACDYAKQGSAIEFHFVGNVSAFIPESLRAYCILHGEITEQARLNALYKEFHIIIIASSREGFPMVLMEAMMQGVVPVSTDVGGIPEHIINDENGLLVASAPDDELLNAFRIHLNNMIKDRAHLQRLSRSAHSYAIRTFNKDFFVASYRDLLM